MPLPAHHSLTRDVTEDERTRFEDHGVVHLRAIYPLDWVQFLAAQLDEVFDDQARAMDQREVAGDSDAGIRIDMTALATGLRSKVPGLQVAFQDGHDAEVAGRSVVETDAASWHAGLRAHHIVGPMPELVAQVTGSDKVNYYADQVFLKEPGSQIRTPFHQDLPYFLVEGQVAVCWAPVDSVGADNGPMGYVRGSHRWNKVFKPSDFVTDTGTFPEENGIEHGDLEPMPPISDADHDLVYFDAEPGDVIVHHWATVHGSASK